MPGGILFGIDEQIHDLVELDVFDHRVCQNANVGIFAPSGGGKTFFTKVLARRYILLTDNTDVIVIDRKHEYRGLCDAMGGQLLRLAASSPHRINPFDLPPPDPNGEGSVLLDHIQQVLGLLDVLLAEPGQRLSLSERAVLDRAIKDAYLIVRENQLMKDASRFAESVLHTCELTSPSAIPHGESRVRILPSHIAASRAQLS